MPVCPPTRLPATLACLPVSLIIIIIIPYILFVVSFLLYYILIFPFPYLSKFSLRLQINWTLSVFQIRLTFTIYNRNKKKTVIDKNHWFIVMWCRRVRWWFLINFGNHQKSNKYYWGLDTKYSSVTRLGLAIRSTRIFPGRLDKKLAGLARCRLTSVKKTFILNKFSLQRSSRPWGSLPRLSIKNFRRYKKNLWPTQKNLVKFRKFRWRY